jgi:hypothetical protein
VSAIKITKEITHGDGAISRDGSTRSDQGKSPRGLPPTPSTPHGEPAVTTEVITKEVSSTGFAEEKESSKRVRGLAMSCPDMTDQQADKVMVNCLVVVWDGGSHVPLLRAWPSRWRSVGA